MSSILYTPNAPASVRKGIVDTLAARGAQWCDYSATGARPVDRATPAAMVPLAVWADAVKDLRDRHGFDFLVDHTAVDYPDREPRFTIVAVLENLETHEVLVLKTRVAENQPVPSLAGLYRSADWAERETFDMFGIPFAGHPDLTRIYMPQDYDGWPARRDFPMEGHLRFRD